MITISVDLGNAPSVLAALGNPSNAQLLANTMAEAYVDDMLDWIASGRSFTGRSGQLAQSIGWHPAGGGSAKVYASSDYAGFVEHGTGIPAGHDSWKYGPRDRKALRFPVGGGGGFAFARSVVHEGSQPHPFFFADLDNRQQHMQAVGLSVLSRIIANAQ